MANQEDYFVHESSYIDEGVHIGKGTKIWHYCHIMKNARLGESCNLGQNVFVGEGVQLGNGLKIQNNVAVYAGVTCEDEVFLGPSMVFTNIKNPRAGIPRKDQYVRTYVKLGATIGANATIICGVTIGRYAFIGAGAVVTRDVPDYALIMGNPGRMRGFVSEYGHELDFDNGGRAVCPETQCVYRLIDNQTVEKVS